MCIHVYACINVHMCFYMCISTSIFVKIYLVKKCLDTLSLDCLIRFYSQAIHQKTIKACL